MESFRPISQAILLFDPSIGHSASECVFAGVISALGSALVIFWVGIVSLKGLAIPCRNSLTGDLDYDFSHLLEYSLCVDVWRAARDCRPTIYDKLPQ